MESVIRVRMLAAPPDSLALALDRIRLGIAIAAMIRMMATTISSSISEKPFCLRIFSFTPDKNLFLAAFFELKYRGQMCQTLSFDTASFQPLLPVKTKLYVLGNFLRFHGVRNVNEKAQDVFSR